VSVLKLTALKAFDGGVGLRTKRGMRNHPTPKGLLPDPLPNGGRSEALKPWPIRPHFHDRSLRGVLMEGPVTDTLWAWPKESIRFKSIRNKRLRMLKHILKRKIIPNDLRIISRLTRSSWERLLSFVRRFLPSGHDRKVAEATNFLFLLSKDVDSDPDTEYSEPVFFQKPLVGPKVTNSISSSVPKKGKYVPKAPLKKEVLREHTLLHEDPPRVENSLRKRLIRTAVPSACFACAAPCSVCDPRRDCGHKCWFCANTLDMIEFRKENGLNHPFEWKGEDPYLPEHFDLGEEFPESESVVSDKLLNFYLNHYHEVLRKLRA
jgi:hypothetical protein